MNSRQDVLDEALLRRVYSEFLEMPGLRLTCPQAQRLWGLDERTCAELLQRLIDMKFLCRLGNGMYTRLTDGNAIRARTRMIKAQLVDGMARAKEAT